MSAWERYAYYYLSLIQSNPGDWQRLEGELEQIRRAWTWVNDINGDAGLILAYVWAVRPFLEQRALWREAIAWYQRGLAAAQNQGQTHDVGALWNNLGAAWYTLSEWSRARECYEQALTIFRQLDDRPCQARALNGLGLVSQAEGKITGALHYYEQALQLFRVEGDSSGEATVLQNMGRAYADLEQWDDAISFYEQALALYRTQDDQVAIASTLNNLAITCRNKADVVSSAERDAWYSKALTYGSRALELFVQTGHRFHEAVALGNLGELAQCLGQLDKARLYSEQALEIFREIGAPLQEAISLANLGSLYSAIGDFERALDYNERALTLFEGLGSKVEQATLLDNIAAIHQTRYAFDEALTYRKKALSLWRMLNNKNAEAHTLAAIGEIHLHQREFHLARENLEQARQLFQSLANRKGEAIALNNLALACQFEGDIVRSRVLYAEALRLAIQAGDQELANTVSHNLARLARETGEERDH